MYKFKREKYQKRDSCNKAIPDTNCVTVPLAQKLKTYYESGGKLILSHRAGHDAHNDWLLDFLPLSFHGEAALWPTFWRNSADFLPNAQGERVFYERGLNAKSDGATVLMQRVLPYFQRTDVHFCSHSQTPPQKDANKFAAILRGERWVYFADPIFRGYRQTGNIAARDGWKSAMQRLVGGAPFGDGLPTTIFLAPRRKNRDLLLTLLHYVPVRKCLDIDVIEERMSFGGLTLKLPQNAQTVRIADTDRVLDVAPDGFVLPQTSGRLILQVDGYFA